MRPGLCSTRVNRTNSLNIWCVRSPIGLLHCLRPLGMLKTSDALEPQALLISDNVGHVGLMALLMVMTLALMALHQTICLLGMRLVTKAAFLWRRPEKRSTFRHPMDRHWCSLDRLSL